MSYVDPKTGEVSGRRKPPKKNRKGKSTKEKILGIFIEPTGFSFRVKPIPIAILVVGVYFAYKKFIKK